LAVASGALFLGVFVAVQWPFANFLMSDGARNAFFGAHYFGYYTHPQSYLFRRIFLPMESDFWYRMPIALLFATLSMRLGFGWGDWMRKIRR
jgi:hypothetical protein